MALNLSVSDKGDGTGATATIAGSGGASVNVLTQNVAANVWTTSGTIVGDGSLNLALTPGYYWAVAISGANVSPVVAFNASLNTEAVMYRCLLGVQAGVQAMINAGSLSGIAASSVYVKMILDDKNTKFPAVFLTPTDMEQALTTGTNAKDDISYPVVVQIVDRNAKDYVTKMPTYLLWRQAIRRYFIHQRLSGVQEVNTCEFVPEIIFDQRLRDYQYLVSPFVLRFIAREIRGVA